MNVRLKCSCGARFITGDELRGQVVRCPKCRKTLRVPENVPVETAATGASGVIFQTEDEDESPTAPESRAAAESPSRWQARETAPSDRAPRTGAWKWLLLILVLLVPLGIVGVLVVLPYFTPKDPREVVAKRYLEAVSRGDFAEANRLSVIVNEHPRNVTRVDHVAPAGPIPAPVSGRFSGLRQFHSEIAAKYTYNEARGRFDPNDQLGMGLDALSSLEEIKRKAEEAAKSGDAPPKKYSNPEEKLLDDVISRYGAFGEIAKEAGGLLSSGTLGPTYEDLLKRTNVQLSAAEQALAQHYLRDPAKWKRLLGDRPFFDLPDLGNFELYDVELVASIRTEGQSLGEPGRPIKLRLVRFVMGSIDTGWRVWKAE